MYFLMLMIGGVDLFFVLMIKKKLVGEKNKFFFGQEKKMNSWLWKIICSSFLNVDDLINCAKVAKNIKTLISILPFSNGLSFDANNIEYILSFFCNLKYVRLQDIKDHTKVFKLLSQLKNLAYLDTWTTYGCFFNDTWIFPKHLKILRIDVMSMSHLLTLVPYCTELESLHIFLSAFHNMMDYDIIDIFLAQLPNLKCLHFFNYYQKETIMRNTRVYFDIYNWKFSPFFCLHE